MRAKLLMALFAFLALGSSQTSAATIVVATSYWNYLPSVGPYYSAYYVPGRISYPAYVPAYFAPPTMPPSPAPIYINAAYSSYCRQYSRLVNRHGYLQERFGTVCLQPDGNWRAVH